MHIRFNQRANPRRRQRRFVPAGTWTFDKEGKPVDNDHMSDGRSGTVGPLFGHRTNLPFAIRSGKRFYDGNCVGLLLGGCCGWWILIDYFEWKMVEWGFSVLYESAGMILWSYKTQWFYNGLMFLLLVDGSLCSYVLIVIWNNMN